MICKLRYCDEAPNGSLLARFLLYLISGKYLHDVPLDTVNKITIKCSGKDFSQEALLIGMNSIY